MNRRSPRIVVRSEGGIGNQLFQYAMGRALSLRLNLPLVIDSERMYRGDRYSREFLLPEIAPSTAPPSSLERKKLILAALLTKFIQKFAANSRAHHEWRMPWGIAIRDCAKGFQPPFLPLYSSFSPPSLFLMGYWQSLEYFEDFESQLLAELSIPPPTDKSLLSLGERVAREEAVALGVRLYEEEPRFSRVNQHTGARLISKINYEVNRATVPARARYYVFSTHDAPLLQQIITPNPAVLVTPDHGFSNDPLDMLWLLSQFRHHIFSWSSFYWWGAWFSRKTHQGRSQYISGEDHPSNRDFIPARWKAWA